MNAATHKLSLWIDNDEGLHNAVREIVKGIGSEYEKHNALKDMIEEIFYSAIEQIKPQALQGMVLDLLALEEIDFEEIYRNNLDEDEE